LGRYRLLADEINTYIDKNGFLSVQISHTTIRGLFSSILSKDEVKFGTSVASFLDSILYLPSLSRIRQIRRQFLLV
jgi:hypothetical protein